MARPPKSRFRSATLKKIEKQVREEAIRFLSCVENRRGQGFASGANRRGKPIMDSNTGHMSNTLSNEKLASSAMNASKINKRDVANDANRQDNVASLLDGQTPTKDSNTRHMNSSTMDVSLDRDARKNNRRDDGVTYHDSQLDRPNPLKDKNMAMHASLEMLSRTDNKRSGAVEANRQGNHASQPIKHDPPRNNTHTKRVEPIMPNGNFTHGTKNFDGLDGYNDALPSRLKRIVRRGKRGAFIDDKHSDREFTVKATEEASPKRMKKQRNKEAKGDDTSDRNRMGEVNGDAYALGVKDYSERNLTYGQRGNMKRNEDEAIDNDDMKLMEVEDGGTQLETCDRRLKNKKKRGIESNEVGDDKADDSFAKKKLESLPKDHVSFDCSNEAIQPDKVTHRKLKKWRRDTMRNEDEELHVDGGDHSPLDADGDNSRLISQAPISIDCLAEVPTPFVLEHVKKQCNYCSKPIDKPIWSGIFKIDGEEDISLAGHLSTKSCDKVWELSRSLVPVVEVTKLSRLKFEIWETSKPSCGSIGLYFFPNNMRHDEDLDKLVKEVIDDDLVLETVIGEAEMLIFPSTLLPERYKTFRRKHYLWGVFRPRQDQCATFAKPVHDTVCCAQEKEKEEQHASNQQDDVQEVHWKSSAESMQQAATTRGIPGSPDMGFQPEGPEGGQLGDALRHTLYSAEATAVTINPAAVTTAAAALVTHAATTPAEATENDTNGVTIPTEATKNDTNAATIPGNHAQSNSTVGVPSGRFFCFVAGQTPKLVQLIQEMQREGSLVLAIRGEAIGAAGPLI